MSSDSTCSSKDRTVGAVDTSNVGKSTPSKRKATALLSSLQTITLQSDSTNKRRSKGLKEAKLKSARPGIKGTLYKSISIPKFTRPNLETTHEHLIESYKQFAEREVKRVDAIMLRNEKKREARSEIKRQKQQTQEQQQHQQHIEGEGLCTDIQVPKEDREKDAATDQGWTAKDFLELDPIHDFLPDEFGFDYLEEGRKLTADDNTISKMPREYINYLMGLANGDNFNSCADNQNENKRSNNNCISSREYKKYIETRMWHVPTVPPNETHLEFLLLCAGFKLHQSEVQAREMPYDSPNKDNYPSDAEFKVVTYKVYGSSEDDSDDSNDSSCSMSSISYNSAYEPFRNFKVPKEVKGWGWVAKKKEKKRNVDDDDRANERVNELKNLYGSFDETALVSLGMLIEECMNVTLFPLARDHVSRCRMLDHLKHHQEDHDKIETGQQEFLSTSNDPYTQWTLPPDEAIVHLCQRFRRKKQQHSKNAYLPSSSSPLGGMSMNCSRTTNGSRKSNQEPSEAWCESHGFDYDFVVNNIDLFEQFIRDPDERMIKQHIEYYHQHENSVKRALAKASLNQMEDTSVENDELESWPIPEIHMPVSGIDIEESVTSSSS